MGRKRLMITLLLNIVYGYAIFGRLITTPRNTRSTSNVINGSMLNCSSTLGSDNISWFFVPAGESINSTIASRSIVYPDFTQLYWIDQPTRNDSNLIIRRTNESTIGTFTCADSEMVSHAQLIIYYSSTSSSLLSNVTVGDVINVTCGVTYLGNPLFALSFYLYDTLSTFKIIDNTTSPQLNTSNSWIAAKATFYLNVSCYMFLQLQCNTEFSTLVDKLLPSSAINSLGTHGHGVGLLTTNGTCIATDKNMTITGAISGAGLFFGSLLTCHVTSDPPANYSWTDLTYGNSSIGHYLMVWHDGSYQCTASNYVKGQWYSATKTVYNLTVEKLSSTAKPLYGPIAGGTKVTVTLENWSKQVTNVSAVYLGGILKTTVLESNRSSNSFMMITSNATTTLIGQPLPMTIEFLPGSYNITTNLSFTYQGNPEITGISPTTFIVTGGTLVTATGTHLSSVANPLIQAIVVEERGIERNTTSEVSLESCQVIPGNGSKMVCPMPRINISDDFLQVLDSQHNNRSKRDTFLMNHIPTENLLLLSRHKRSSSALSLIGTNGVDRVVIYVGFILDGYRKYENINNVIPETQILFFSPPEINSSKDILEFDPTKDELISVKGNHMTRGCRMADYLVQVGGDVCENNELHDNQLSCRPPKVKPLSTTNDTIYCGDQHLSVTITLGNLQYRYACLAYTDQSLTRKVALIIGLTVGLAGFVLFLAILIICIVRCCREKSIKRPYNRYNSRQETRESPYENSVQLESRQDDVYLQQPYHDTILRQDDVYVRQHYRDTILPNES